MTSLTTRTVGLGLFTLFLLGCPSEDPSENQEETSLSYYEQCLEYVEGAIESWQDDGCIDVDGKGSGSIISREEAGDDSGDIGQFSLLFGPNQEKEECYNSTYLSYQSGILQLTHAGAENAHIIDLS